MAYLFQGFFASTSTEHAAQQLLEAVQVRWPDAVARLIEDPFLGIGVSAYRDSAMEAELLDWSMQFPQLVFAYIEAECTGVCEYRGSVCSDGDLLQYEEWDDGSVEVLQDLLSPLGVTLDERGYFAPFERGFFA